MKIIYKSKNKPKRLCLWLPTSLLTSRLGLKLIARATKFSIEHKESKPELKEALTLLKRFIRQNGHFNMVEVHSSEEDIIIRL